MKEYANMSDQLNHLRINKQNLELRFEILKLIRAFFEQAGFVEVDTPLIVEKPGQEPFLSPMKINIHDEKRKKFSGYLHTSPEYTMKKLLATGFEKIFFLGKCFRDFESFGGTHNPEFTMCEWYRAGEDMFKIMDDVESLFNYIIEKLFKNFKFQISNFQSNSSLKFQRLTMKELWNMCVGVDLDEYLTSEKMFELGEELGFKPEKDEAYEDLFYRIFLNKIEPQLKEPTIVYLYPMQMAALSKASEKYPGYAERFEVYVNGIELANAFSELTDSKEQLKRLKEEKELRKKLNKDIYDIDQEFIEALEIMPKTAGIALGVDRLVQIFAALRQGSGQGCKNIDIVITLPASKLFNL